MRRYNKFRKGITLVELILTLGILTVAMAAIYSVFFTSNKFSDLNIGKGLSQQSGRLALDYINRELKPVKAVYLSESDIANEKINIYYSLSLDNEKLIHSRHQEASIERKTIADYISELKFNIVKGERLKGNIIKLRIVTSGKKHENIYEIDIYFENGEILRIPENQEDVFNKIYYTRYD